MGATIGATAKGGTVRVVTAKPWAASVSGPGDGDGEARRGPTKAQLCGWLAARCGLSRPQVASVIEGLAEAIAFEVGKKGSGRIVVPGIGIVRRVERPARKAREGRNPFTGQPMTFAARKASAAVRIRPARALGEAVR